MKKKSIPIFFFLAIVFHSSISIVNNFLSLGYFKNINMTALNKAGQLYAKITPTDVYYPLFLTYYSNYAGIDRGYAFYSPNLNRNKIEYNFIIGNTSKLISIPFHSSEGKIKYISISTNLTNVFDNRKKRNRMVKDIAKFILSHHTNIKEMNLSISVKKIRLLNEEEKYDKKIIDAFHIKR